MLLTCLEKKLYKVFSVNKLIWQHKNYSTAKLNVMNNSKAEGKEKCHRRLWVWATLMLKKLALHKDILFSVADIDIIWQG